MKNHLFEKVLLLAISVASVGLVAAPGAKAGDDCNAADPCIPTPQHCLDEDLNCVVGDNPPTPCLAQLGCHRHSDAPGQGHENGDGQEKSRH